MKKKLFSHLLYHIVPSLSKANVFLIFVLFLFFDEYIHAQSSISNISDLPQLADNPVNKIAIDDRGIIWLATQKGIYQYNGFECKEPNNLIDSTLDICILQSQAFFCTPHHLYTFNIRQKDFSFEEIAHFPQTIKQIIPYQKGLMIAFADSGMTYIEAKNPFKKLINNDLKISAHTICVWKNNLLIGNYEGLFEIKFNENQFSVKAFEDSLFAQKAIKSLYSFKDSLLFVLDYEGNIAVLDANHKVQAKIKVPAPIPLINHVLFENQDLILFSDNQIFRYLFDGHLWLKKELNLLFENEKGLLCMQEDLAGNVWFGSKNNGLYRYGLFVEKIPTIEVPHAIFAVYPPSSQEIWYATEKGIFRLHWENGLAISDPIQGLNAQKIIATYITGDSKDNIWVGTFDKGIYVCSRYGKHIQHFTSKNGLLNDNILHIFFNKEKVWLSSFGGVSEGDISTFEIGKKILFQNFSNKNGFNSNYTYQVSTNFSHNALYFATEGKGAIQFENEIFGSVAEIPSNDNVYSIFSDKEDNVFFLTEKDKLFFGKMPHLQQIDLNKSGKSAFIFALLDKNDNILFGYKEGLMVMEKNNHQFRDLGKAYSLGKMEPNINSYASFANGRILIGSNKGLFLYSPLSAHLHHQANIYIESIEVDLQAIDIQKDSIFKYDQNDFSIHFGGVWLTEPEKLRYRYKLSGLNENWVMTKDRFVNFANLPPGKYTFTVESTIHHSFDEAKSVTYTFAIEPPFWATPLFIFFAILGIVGIFFGIIKWREYALNKTATLKKQQIEMELQILKNQINPHFLFNSLNTLVGIIEESPKEAVNFVEHLSTFYRNILKYKEVDMISLKEEWNILQEYLYLLRTRFQDNITFDVQIAEDSWEKKIPAFSLQMLLENAIKHNIISNSKPLRIEMSSQNTIFIFQNTYQPKQSILHSTGIGLKNINSRFLLLTQREISIEQTASYFRVCLPLT